MECSLSSTQLTGYWLTAQRLAGTHTDDLLAGTHF